MRSISVMRKSLSILLICQIYWHATAHAFGSFGSPPPPPPPFYDPGPHPDVAPGDAMLINFANNLEYLEAEFFLWSAFGYGLDKIAPNLTGGGPSPIGVQKADLDDFTMDIVAQLAIQEVGHLSAIRETLKLANIPRPLLNLSCSLWADVLDSAFGEKLDPPFDPYANSLNLLIACYAIPYVGLTGYVGAIPNLIGYTSKRLVAGLLGVEAGQDAIIRTLLYQRRDEVVKPYPYSVADFTNNISKLRNLLDKASSVDDLGLTSPPSPATASLIPLRPAHGNILSADMNWVAFSRTPDQILRIVYSTGDPSKPGGFYPKGANGEIAAYYLW